MQQSSTTRWFLGVAEDICMLSLLLAVYLAIVFGMVSSLHRTSFLIDFYTCIIMAAAAEDLDTAI